MRVTVVAALFAAGVRQFLADGEASESCHLQLHGKGELKSAKPVGGGEPMAKMPLDWWDFEFTTFEGQMSDHFTVVKPVSEWVDLFSKVPQWGQNAVGTPRELDRKLIEGSFEVKLPTIWTAEKQSWAEAERREE